MEVFGRQYERTASRTTKRFKDMCADELLTNSTGLRGFYQPTKLYSNRAQIVLPLHQSSLR